MRWFNSTTGLAASLAAAVGLAAILGGCGVNKLPEYRNRISQVKLESAVATSAAVHFVSLNDYDASDPDSVALDVIEAQIRNRLAERVDRLAHPATVADVFGPAVEEHLTRRFDWRVAEPGSAYDTRFLIEVTDYGVEVGADGLAFIYYDSDVSGWFALTDELIYEKSFRTAMPLTEAYRGTDPVSDAAARALNLLSLDELTDHAFRDGFFAGASFAADDLSRGMRSDAN